MVAPVWHTLREVADGLVFVYYLDWCACLWKHLVAGGSDLFPPYVYIAPSSMAYHFSLDGLNLERLLLLQAFSTMPPVIVPLSSLKLVKIIDLFHVNGIFLGVPSQMMFITCVWGLVFEDKHLTWRSNVGGLTPIGPGRTSVMSYYI